MVQSSAIKFILFEIVNVFKPIIFYPEDFLITQVSVSTINQRFQFQAVRSGSVRRASSGQTKSYQGTDIFQGKVRIPNLHGWP